MRAMWGCLGLALAFKAVVLAGCSEGGRTAPTEGSPVRRALSTPPEKADTRYMKIRALLELPPESRRRATELYGLVRPICTEPAARAEFLETARWSVGFGSREFYLPISLALEVLEHVVSVCARASLEGTLDLLRGAESFLGTEAQLHVLVARTLATADRLDEAKEAAHRARHLGSAHAVALAASIEARLARSAQVGYAPGMLDQAIATASAEPTADWHAIDLAAVLSTRARLLLEKGLWTQGATALESRREAEEIFRRLLEGPFPHEVRRRASDALCFESADLGLDSDACRRAGEVFGHLGAAYFAHLDRPVEAERRLDLTKLAARVSRLPAGALVLVAFRGDEQELLEWARPAARLIGALAGPADARRRVLVIDRTATPRASALVARILALAGVEPWRRLEARDDTQAVPCLSAILAERRTPASCPLERPLQRALEAEAAPALALLVGRDLDAEIDDLRLYEHPVVLASFRRSEMEKRGLEAWLKSLSDVLVVAPASRP